MKRHIKKLYRLKRGEICSRLKDFETLWLESDDEKKFEELAFCILTPQTKAKVSWEAIERLKEQGLLFKGNAEQIVKGLFDVRFKNNKAKYIENARKFFTKNGKICMKAALKQWNDDVYTCREWLVQNIRGIGYKEASHFLRNIGFGEKVAILDRHILKNLKQLRIIKEIPKSISRTRYLQIEEDMKDYAEDIDIPLAHLDLLFWYKETGEIFK